ncbi:MAG: hypothetical protein FWH33_11445, partial [Oscillospiraceae bacterium]|nr:hypothetical protein [Oscillospiraceae bacterium]
MRLRLAFKTLLRSAARTALTVILLGAVAFALISQAMEHAITDREAKAAAAQYYGVGSVQAAAPDVPAWAYAGNPYHLTLESGETGVYQLLTQEQVDAVLSLPYVSSYDMRLMTAGVSNDHARLDDGAYFFNFSMRCVVEATVYREIESYESGDVNYFVNEANLLAGFVKSLSEKPTMQTCDADTLFIVYGLKLPYTAPDSSFLSILYGGRTRSLGFYFPGIEYGCEQLNNMKVGDRCAFVLRFMPIPESEQRLYDMGDFIYEMGDYVYCIGDYMSNSWCEAVWPLNDAPEGYLELDEYAPLRELIEIT